MKKLVSLMLGIAGFTMIANASTFYVDPTSGIDTNAGTTWATAVKTISKATTLATANPGVDDVFVKQGTITALSSLDLRTITENYYGGFQGTETSPSDRQMNDNDGNGIIEPWEFKYPTVYTSTYIGTLIYGSAYIFDGFKISHKNVLKSDAMLTSLIIPVGGTFQNCIISESDLTYTDMATYDLGGCLIKTSGTFKNNLVEGNTVKVTNSPTSSRNTKITPILEITAPTTTATISVSGSVFRNNKAIITNTSTVIIPPVAPSTTNGTIISYLRGMIISFSDGGVSGTASTKSTATVSNCLVYNNEITYVGNATYPTASYASVIGNLAYSGANTTHNIINCTFANNKMVDLKNACLTLYVGGNVSPDYIINNATNNVFWNNQNTITATTTTSNCALSSGSAQNPGSIISNNVSDVVAGGNWGTVANFTNINNLVDLNKANSGTNAPSFVKPSSVVGYSADGSVVVADWRIKSDSYLIGKGTATTILTDKVGFAFATPSAAGAYEYQVLPTALNQISNNNADLLTVTNKGVISNVNGVVEIFTVTGQELKKVNVTVGQQIVLSSGIYIVRIKSNEGTVVQKVIL